MKKKRLGFAGLWLLLALVFLGGIQVFGAELPKLSEENYLLCYPFSRESIEVYQDRALEELIDEIPYGECKVIAVKKKAAKIEYFQEDTTKQGWIALDRLVYDTKYASQKIRANTPVSLMKRAKAGDEYGMMLMYSGGITMSEKGKWIQVCVRTDDCYRMGWMLKSHCLAIAQDSIQSTEQLLAKGYYTISPKDKPKLCLEYDKKKGTVALKKANGSAKQQFLLEHTKENRYVLTSRDGKAVIALNGSKRLAESEEETTWLAERCGGYFYLTETSRIRRLAVNGTKPVGASVVNASSRQWKLTRAATTPTMKNITVFSQEDPKWADSTYYNGPIRRTIATSGCGLVALTNAVYALNGEFIHPSVLAKFSVENGHYFYMSGTDNSLYPNAGRQLGGIYHFRHVGKTFSLDAMRQHLQSGGTAIALVPGHYIAIAAYDGKNNSYLVLDSSTSSGRRPTSPDGSWINASVLVGGGFLHCQYYHLFSRA